MPLRAVYTDLDGTLLGKGASLFRDADGGFTLLPARALEACHRAGVEVVLKSGRRRAQVMEDARLIGQSSYIFEVGAGMSIDGELTWLTGDLQPREGLTVHAQIERGGAPALLLERYAGRLEPHAPWHLEREVSHLFRGKVDTAEADELLAAEGHGDLRLVDNGGPRPRHARLSPDPQGLLEGGRGRAPHAGARLRARGMHRRGRLGRGPGHRCRRGPLLPGGQRGGRRPGRCRRFANVEVTEAAMGEGFYEAVIRALAEGR